MAGTKRVAGTAFITMDGAQLALRGNLMVSLSKVERTGIAGMDRTHGYTEKPRVQYIEGDFTLVEGTSIEQLDNITDATIVAQLANGNSYSLFEAWTKAAHELNAEQGQVRIRWEGMDGSEF